MKYKLSNKELNVMQVLWASEKPLSITDFTKYDPSLNTSTVQAALRSLLQKSYIRVAGIEQHKKVFARTYLPSLSETDYMLELFQKSSVNSGSFFAALVKKEDAKTLEEIEKIIEEQKKKLLKKEN